MEPIPHRADTVCFACYGSGPNSVNHGEILLEYGSLAYLSVIGRPKTSSMATGVAQITDKSRVPPVKETAPCANFRHNHK